MKRLAALMAIAISPGSIFAANGPYLGAGLGYSDTIFNIDESGSVKYISTTNQSQKSFRGVAGGFQGQFVAGYAYNLKRFRLGAEITAQLPKTTYDETSTSDNSFHYESSYTYGVNFVPSYYITDCSAIYAKIGATRGKFAYRNSSHDGYSILDTSFYSTGFNLGLGAEIYLTKQASLRLEYLYTNYITRKFESDLVVATPDHGTVIVDIDTHIQPQMHTVILGFNYQFSRL